MLLVDERGFSTTIGGRPSGVKDGGRSSPAVATKVARDDAPELEPAERACDEGGIFTEEERQPVGVGRALLEGGKDP
jgi:hypothetical protein